MISVPEMITVPGIYPDMSAADYYADPTPTPSVTQSLIKVILDRSPLHAWHAHPKLNPAYKPDDDTKYDIGMIAHKLMLGRGRDPVILEFDDWRTKAAREAREAAIAEGKFAVLEKHFVLASAMVKVAREQLATMRLRHLFADESGDSEVVLAWPSDGAQRWRRQMVDWLSADRRIFADYKTTSESAAPHALARRMIDHGWDIQAAMCELGLAEIDDPARRRFIFVVQETAPPYCLSVVELSEAVLTMGRKKLDVGLDVWDRCMSTGIWPGYPQQVIVPDYPAWAEAQWLEREQTEFAA